MLSATGSPLVAGSAISENTQMQTMHIKVLRAFRYKGETVPVNDKLEVPTTFGRELIAANKAEAIEPPAPKTAPARVARVENTDR